MSDDLENLYNEFRKETADPQKEQRRAQLIESIQEVADNWPDQLALYRGMVNQAIEDGWEDMAAKAIVLNSILGGQQVFIIANIKTVEELAEDDD